MSACKIQPITAVHTCTCNTVYDADAMQALHCFPYRKRQFLKIDSPYANVTPFGINDGPPWCASCMLLLMLSCPNRRITKTGNTQGVTTNHSLWPVTDWHRQHQISVVLVYQDGPSLVAWGVASALKIATEIWSIRCLEYSSHMSADDDAQNCAGAMRNILPHTNQQLDHNLTRASICF